MGTTCSLKWREAAETEHLWVTEAAHEGDVDRAF